MDGMECDWNPVKLVPSVGQSINQSINQSVNQSTALHRGPRRQSDQIRSDSTQLEIGSDPRTRVVASRPILTAGVVWWGVRRGDADAMRCNPPAAADDFLFFACLLAC
jgi:hypothetical protein